MKQDIFNHKIAGNTVPCLYLKVVHPPQGWNLSKIRPESTYHISRISIYSKNTLLYSTVVRTTPLPPIALQDFLGKATFCCTERKKTERKEREVDITAVLASGRGEGGQSYFQRQQTYDLVIYTYFFPMPGATFVLKTIFFPFFTTFCCPKRNFIF